MREFYEPDMWRAASSRLTLPDDEVHVWRVELDAAPDQVRALHQLLSFDEQGRAGRFHFEKDRNHYIVGRGVLRKILAQYLNDDPQQLTFSYNAYGKPILGKNLLEFNVSHSHGLELIGLTRKRQLGIDLEFIRRNFACQEIAERMFSSQEYAALQELPAHLQREGFFNCWTRKEAFIKAHGLGLSYPLDQFEVSLTPQAPAKLISVAEDDDLARWSLTALAPGDDFAAALVVEGQNWELKCWQW